jgi:hypothetical protein
MSVLKRKMSPKVKDKFRTYIMSPNFTTSNPTERLRRLLRRERLQRQRVREPVHLRPHLQRQEDRIRVPVSQRIQVSRGQSYSIFRKFTLLSSAFFCLQMLEDCNLDLKTMWRSNGS